MAVPDDDLRDAQRSLAAAEGVFGEPSGAVGMAALAGMLDEGAILPGETVVAVVTGGGFRDVSSARIRVTEPTVIDDSLEGLRRYANQLYPLADYGAGTRAAAEHRSSSLARDSSMGLV